SAEEDQVPVEGPRGGRPAGDRRRRAALGTKLGKVALEIFRRDRGDGFIEPSRKVVEVTSVGVDGPRRARSGKEREEALDLGASRRCCHQACLRGPPAFACGRTPGFLGGGGLRPPEPYLRGTRVNRARGPTGETGFPP